MDRAGYRPTEHTADLAFELWGPTEADVLVQGMRAVCDELTDGHHPSDAGRREVTFAALDPADRLVRWLNEILYLATVQGFVPARAEIVLPVGSLRAVLFGQEDARDLLQTEIKSATYHDLSLAERPDGQWRATVVMDV